MQDNRAAWMLLEGMKMPTREMNMRSWVDVDSRLRDIRYLAIKIKNKEIVGKADECIFLIRGLDFGTDDAKTSHHLS